MPEQSSIDLAARAQAGEALYWAIYYGNKDWIEAIFGNKAGRGFVNAYHRAGQVFGTGKPVESPKNTPRADQLNGAVGILRGLIDVHQAAATDGTPLNPATTLHHLHRLAREIGDPVPETTPAVGEEHHVIDLRDDGWTIMHPLACRPNLFDCPIDRAAGRDGDLATHITGRFRCQLNTNGKLEIGEEITCPE